MRTRAGVPILQTRLRILLSRICPDLDSWQGQLAEMPMAVRSPYKQNSIRRGGGERSRKAKEGYVRHLLTLRSTTHLSEVDMVRTVPHSLAHLTDN